MEQDYLAKALAQALTDPAVIRAMQNAMQDKPLQPDDSDIILIDEAMKETKLCRVTIYRQTSAKWQSENPHRTPIPHFKRGNKLYFSRKKIRLWLLGKD